MIYSRVKTALVNTEMSLTYIGPHCWKQKFGQCSSSGLLRDSPLELKFDQIFWEGGGVIG